MLRLGCRVQVERGDLLHARLHGRSALVNPANSMGIMGGGVAGALRRAGGEAIEAEARRRAPIPLGGALLTTAGSLPLFGIIHAPTMLHPGQPASAEVVREACLAAVKLAHGERIESLAFPGMGTGTGGLEPAFAAEAMVQGIVQGLEEVRSPPPARIALVAYDEELARAFEDALASRA